MTSVDAAILAMMMRYLAPSADVPALAEAIVASGATWDEATMLVGIAFREGSNRLRIIGDQGRARCTYQVHHAPVGVLTDAGLCTRLALHHLRASARLCPSAPLAAYAGAPCSSAVAGRISRDRRRVADRALAAVLGGGQ